MNYPEQNRFVKAANRAETVLRDYLAGALADSLLTTPAIATNSGLRRLQELPPFPSLLAVRCFDALEWDSERVRFDIRNEVLGRGVDTRVEIFCIAVSDLFRSSVPDSATRSTNSRVDSAR